MEFFHTNWNNLPNEIKFIIIRRMDNNTRLALRVCSRNDQQLVDSVPIRSIHRITLYYAFRLKNWHMNIWKTAYKERELCFSSFEELQQKLIEELKKNDCCRELIVPQMDTARLLKLTTDNSSVKIKKLLFNRRVFNSVDVLKQVDPHYLKKLQIPGDPIQSNPLMEHFNAPKLSIVGVNHFRDDQLLNLENAEVRAENCQSLTSFGIVQFIKKRLLILNEKKLSFRIGYNDEEKRPGGMFKGLDIDKTIPKKRGTIVVNSPFPGLQLRIGFSQRWMAGKTIYNARRSIPSMHESLSIFQNIHTLEIFALSPSEEKNTLNIHVKNKGGVHYEFDSADELQKRLTEELEGIKYIKKLFISNKLQNWNFRTPKRNQITVGKLTIPNHQNPMFYLQQIEPIHLKKIMFNGNEDNHSLYDMPQMEKSTASFFVIKKLNRVFFKPSRVVVTDVTLIKLAATDPTEYVVLVIHAQFLRVGRSPIRDDQLLKLNAVRLLLQAGNTVNLTDNGINAFLKKRLLTLDQSDLNFCFEFPSERKNVSELIKSLQISIFDRTTDVDTTIIVDSPYPDYQIELKKNRFSLSGKRVEREC